MHGYKEIGELLARAREERQMTVLDVAQVLHIRPRYIEALEVGDMSIMPSLPYAKGYMKRYASYMALDLIEILRRFELASEQGASPFFMPHSFSHEKRLDSRMALVFTGIALFFFLIWILWLRPQPTSLSVVEPVPEKVMEPEPVAAPAPKSEQPPCFGPQKSLYPPCYWQEPEPTKSILHVIQP